jgi:hypothetical protein
MRSTKAALATVLVASLAAASCSRDDAAKTGDSSPQPNVQQQAEQQRKTIDNALEQRRKEQEAAEPASSPSP